MSNDTPTTKVNPAEFGCEIYGLVSGVTPTQKGGFLISVAAQDTMYKVHSKTNGLKLMTPYRGRMRGFSNNMFFEGERL